MASDSFPYYQLIIWSRFLILFVSVIWTKVLKVLITEHKLFSVTSFNAYRSASSGLMENILTFDIILTNVTLYNIILDLFHFV